MSNYDNSPDDPVDPNIPEFASSDQADEAKADYLNFEDYVATIYGFDNYQQASRSAKHRIRLFINDFFAVAYYPTARQYIEQLESDWISPMPSSPVPFDFTSAAARTLDDLVVLRNQGLLAEFVKHFIPIIDVEGENSDNIDSSTRGHTLELLVQIYEEKRAAYWTAGGAAPDPIKILENEINQMSTNGGQKNYHFKLSLDHLDAYSKIMDKFFIDAGRKFAFRHDTPPSPIAAYQCRIGASTFFVPPTQVSVHQGFKSGSLTNGVLRQPSSPKMNLGNSETTITMTLYFPNHETIWGFDGRNANFDIFNWDPNPVAQSSRDEVYGQSVLQQSQSTLVADSTIDRYLSSLRGLVTQFKYAPFLPIKNEYINKVYDITAVAMMGMTVSTVPNFPFVLAVNLQMAKFNFNPFLPMIDHFDQAIHWGKYRQYMGRAAARLESKVNQGFLLQSFPSYDVSGNRPSDQGAEIDPTPINFEGDLLPKFDKITDYNGGRFDFYFPITTPSRIFAADTTDFRQPGENQVVTKDVWDGVLSSLGFDLVSTPFFDFFDYDKAARYAKFRSERKLLYEYLNAVKHFAIDVKTGDGLSWTQLNSTSKEEVIDKIIEKARDAGVVDVNNEAAYRRKLDDEWFFSIYDHFLADNQGFKKLLDSHLYVNSKYTIREWALPMDKLILDWSTCIVNNVSISLSNNFATQQILLQDAPSYQHIGGGDSKIDISMTVIGEDNLVRFRRLFEHIDGLARIEKSHGVLGFLGIKNVITALCGIKYVLPLDFEVNTLENFPHVYEVNMSFIDFDIMQQEREKLSSAQQAEMVERFGKRNPFLRLKQCWGAFNAYPDFPLDVRDGDGSIMGHLDPDWYFRSFTTINNDDDIFNWGFNTETLALTTTIVELEAKLNDAKFYNLSTDDINKIKSDLKAAEADLKDKMGSGETLPPGWVMVNGHLEREDVPGKQMPEPDLIHYLGNFSESKDKIGFIAIFKGGFFALGTEDLKNQNPDTNKVYHTGMSMFKEDLASDNLRGQQSVPGTVPLSDYQHEYQGGVTSANKQYETIMQDYAYRNNRGRMLRAFPTYMLWLIDEGGYFAGIKLFDNFYGLNSVIDFSVVQSEDAIGDTLVLRLSNIYQKLTTPFLDQIIMEDDPLYNTPVGHLINVMQNRSRNLESGLTDTLVEINSIRLKPGVRIHLRAGYGSNPNNLQTVFNGTIAEVEQGDILTVIAQSDAIEFTGILNTVNPKGDSGKLDGNLTGMWMSEPRDLIVRLLTMGSSNFKESMGWAAKGVFFSESRFGIRHFGHILYESMSDEEREGQHNKTLAAAKAFRTDGETDATDIQAVLGDYTTDLSQITSAAGIPGSLFSGNFVSIVKMLWLNQNAKRDYEIFKRNIYPGNGFGIAQFMAGDMIDGGLTVNGFIGSWSEGSFTTGNAPQVQNPTSTPTILAGPYDPAKVKREKEDRYKAVRDEYYSANSIDDEEMMDVLARPLKDPTDFEIKVNEDPGFLDEILSGAGSVVKWVGSTTYDVFDTIDDGISNVFGDSFLGKLGSTGYELLMGGPQSIFKTFQLGSGLIGSMGRIFSATNGIGHMLGLNSGIADDDLKGFDETSFRAQTYMKTVWDMFQLCAALLPNYIIAVRPFEDRSTLFYGKPHWLYTSGVVPVTMGIEKDITLEPKFDDIDQAQIDLLNKASKDASAAVTDMSLKTDAMQAIMQMKVGKDFDPFDPSKSMVVTNRDQINKLLVAYLDENAEDTTLSEDDYTGLVKYIRSGTDTFLPRYGSGKELEKILDLLFKNKGQYGWSPTIDQVRTSLDSAGNAQNLTGNNLYRAYIRNTTFGFTQLEWDKQESDKGVIRTAEQEAEKIWKDNATEKQSLELLKREGASEELRQLFIKDPIAFAYQFGWKFSQIDAFMHLYSPTSGVIVDPVASAARKLYDESFSVEVDSMAGERSFGEAIDIWRDFRHYFPYTDDAILAYAAAFPLEIDGTTLTGGDSMDAVENSHYFEIMDLFMRFLWQDPFNRAWVVATADKDDQSNITFVTGGLYNGFFDSGSSHGTDNTWSWNRATEAFKIFIQTASTKIGASPTAEITSPGARAWMESNRTPGDNTHNSAENAAKALHEWWDSSIGGMIGLIGDLVSGFITSIRMSMAQLGTALSKAAQMQKQANILNASLNDSIYYQMGEPGSLLRLVDNPFTREYGEPVIEIREPFQRLHFITSFDAIIDNKITETLTNVPTVITAVSDGKYPVTVHFDKGIPANRQVEKVVETGLLWDNAFGSGLFGFLQPILHPLESARAYGKLLTGSSDQLSARRVALWHLKEGLKDIYTGEVVIVGDADIRPHDLIYIADPANRMYGMFEAEQVIHHFTPENGFITAITPNAIVTINDPMRWTLLSWVWSKMSSFSLRDDVRATMAVRSERNIAAQSKEITQNDVYKYFGTQMNGAIQYTQGSTAFIRDIGAIYTGGGIKALTAKDKAIEQMAEVDLMLGTVKSFAPLGAAIVGTVVGTPALGVAAGVGTWAVADLFWEAWNWVKENLLDQHGCYIQYLNKDGIAMDGGLSYASGVAVGTNHTISLFPEIMGVPSARSSYKETGNYRITTNDLLASLGWSEVETISLYRESSWFVNQVNAKILKIAGRAPESSPNDNYWTILAEVLDPLGSTYLDSNGQLKLSKGVEDADTIYVKSKTIPFDTKDFPSIQAQAYPGTYNGGASFAVRFSVFNAYELQHHDLTGTPDFNETTLNQKNDLAYMGYQFVVNKFSNSANRIIALRINKNDEKDAHGRTIATIFHNVPLGTQASDRAKVLLQFASQSPPIPFDAYLPDGRPYTLNWEMVMTGYGQVDMRNSLWNTSWRNGALDQGSY